MSFQAPTPRSRRRDLLLLALAVAVAVVLTGILVARQVGDDGAPSARTSAAGPMSQPAEAAARPMGPLGDLARRQPDDPLALGPPHAPVVLVEFADLRCPFCAQFARTVEPLLVDRYVNTGALRIEWRDMPIFGPQSMAAARAARAAGAQGRFWQYTSAAYRAAPPTGHPDLSAAALRTFAQHAGVPDLQRFDADAAGTAFDAAIHADLMQAQALAIPSTPAFSLNGEPVLGAQPAEVFTTMIDNLVAGRPTGS